MLDAKPLCGVAAVSTVIAGRAAVAACLGCQGVGDAEHRFFSWFAIETGTDSAMIAKLRAGGGMCPRHTRAVLAQDGAADRLTTVYRHTLPAIRDRLAHRSALPARRPACDSCRRAESAALATATPSTTAAGTVLCIAHLQQLAAANRQILPRLARNTVGWLSGGPPLPALFVRADTDADARRMLRALIPITGVLGDAGGDWVDTRLRLQAGLRTGVCPICLVVGRQERHYLGWLIDTIRQNPAGLSDESGGICPQHLADLSVAAQDAAGWAIRGEQTRWLARLAAATVGSRRRVRVTLREVLRPQPCLVCRAVCDAAAGQTTMLFAALGGPLRVDYERAAGLCVRHVAQLAPAGQTAELMRRVATAHLGLLVEELGEASRKVAWQARHEPSGPEKTAWVRAAALLDGQVFLGGRPRTRLTAGQARRAEPA